MGLLKKEFCTTLLAPQTINNHWTEASSKQSQTKKMLRVFVNLTVLLLPSFIICKWASIKMTCSQDTLELLAAAWSVMVKGLWKFERWLLSSGYLQRLKSGPWEVNPSQKPSQLLRNMIDIPFIKLSEVESWKLWTSSSRSRHRQQVCFEP